MKISSFLLGSLILAASAATTFATDYAANGGTGFGGNVGLGTLSITSSSDNGGSYTFTFNTGSGKPNFDSNGFALYIDSVAGGFNTTSGFMDSNDGGRSVISGYSPTGNNNGPSQAVVNFASGFNADFGISFENGYVGLFGLANGGNLSLNYVTGANQTGNSPFSVTLTAAQLGLTSGLASLNFVGTYVSTAAYRSNEAVGDALNAATEGGALPAGPNPGFNSSIAFTDYLTYNPVAVPEPGSLACLGLGVLALGGAAVRRMRGAR